MMDQTNAYLYVPKQKSPLIQRKAKSSKVEKPSIIRLAELRRRQASKRSDYNDDDQEKVDRATGRILEFINELEDAQPTLAAAFIQIGPSSDVFPSLSRRLNKLLSTRCSRKYLTLQSSASINLKRMLHQITAAALNQSSGTSEADDSEEPSTQAASSSTINDLRSFQKNLAEHGVDHVIIAFEDSEAFDGLHLASLVEILTIWAVGVHFTLVFGIQTSVDNFRTRLPASCKRALKITRLFDLSESRRTHEQRFWQHVREEQPELLLDAALLDRALPPSAEHIDAGDIYRISKHAEISRFFADDLSLLLSGEAKHHDLAKNTFEVLRNLPSFQKSVDDLINEGDTETVRSVVTDDAALFKFTQSQMQRVQQSMTSINNTMQLMQDCYAVLFRKPLTWNHQERMQILSGHIKNLGSSKILFDGFRLAKQDQLEQIMEIFDTCAELVSDSDLAQARDELKQAGAGKKSAVNGTMLKVLQQHLDTSSTSIQDMYPIEIFSRDSTMSIAALWPKPRKALEAGLSEPELYLDRDRHLVESVIAEKSTPISSPGNPTCMLYQLLQESGALVNVSDWWEAFKALLEDAELDETHMMALFQRGLAELYLLGLIRPSRRKADHVLRTMWAGIA